MLETAAFDPIWTEFNWDREGRCTVPCLKDYAAVFKGKASTLKEEWESYDAPQLSLVDMTSPSSTLTDPSIIGEAREKVSMNGQTTHSRSKRNPPENPPEPEPTDSFAPTSAEEAELRNAGVIADYQLEQDKYPPNNRTLENFFRGAWTYHIHNQVRAFSSRH